VLVLIGTCFWRKSKLNVDECFEAEIRLELQFMIRNQILKIAAPLVSGVFGKSKKAQSNVNLGFLFFLNAIK